MITVKTTIQRRLFVFLVILEGLRAPPCFCFTVKHQMRW